jgi:hypothetical protein
MVHFDESTFETFLPDIITGPKHAENIKSTQVESQCTLRCWWVPAFFWTKAAKNAYKLKNTLSLNTQTCKTLINHKHYNNN